MQDHARAHPIASEGDTILVWVNEGDLYNHSAPFLRPPAPDVAELVEQWDAYVESMGSVMGEVEHMAQQMRDRIATAIRELEAERDVSNEIGRAFEEDAGQQRERAEAAEAKALKDAKAHEKEIAVWSENYAALEQRVQELLAAAQWCVDTFKSTEHERLKRAIEPFATAIRKGATP